MTDPLDTEDGVWSELTPGALGRLALHSDPTDVALDLETWAGRENASLLVSWLRAVADVLETEP